MPKKFFEISINRLPEIANLKYEKPYEYQKIAQSLKEVQNLMNKGVTGKEILAMSTPNDPYSLGETYKQFYDPQGGNRVKIEFDNDGNVDYINGRHRIETARQLGINYIPAEVNSPSQESLEDTSSKFGSERDLSRFNPKREQGESDREINGNTIMSIENPNKLHIKAETIPPGDLVPAKTQNIDELVHQTIEHGKEKGAAPSSKSGSDASALNNSNNKDVQKVQKEIQQTQEKLNFAEKFSENHDYKGNDISKANDLGKIEEHKDNLKNLQSRLASLTNNANSDYDNYGNSHNQEPTNNQQPSETPSSANEQKADDSKSQTSNQEVTSLNQPKSDSQTPISQNHTNTRQGELFSKLERFKKSNPENSGNFHNQEQANKPHSEQPISNRSEANNQSHLSEDSSSKRNQSQNPKESLEGNYGQKINNPTNKETHSSEPSANNKFKETSTSPYHIVVPPHSSSEISDSNKENQKSNNKSMPPQTPEISKPPQAPEVFTPTQTPEVFAPTQTPETDIPAKTPEISKPPQAPEVFTPPQPPENLSSLHHGADGKIQPGITISPEKYAKNMNNMDRLGTVRGSQSPSETPSSANEQKADDSKSQTSNQEVAAPNQPKSDSQALTSQPNSDVQKSESPSNSSTNGYAKLNELLQKRNSSPIAKSQESANNEKTKPEKTVDNPSSKPSLTGDYTKPSDSNSQTSNQEVAAPNQPKSDSQALTSQPNSDTQKSESPSNSSANGDAKLNELRQNYNPSPSSKNQESANNEKTKPDKTAENPSSKPSLTGNYTKPSEPKESGGTTNRGGTELGDRYGAPSQPSESSKPDDLGESSGTSQG